MEERRQYKRIKVDAIIMYQIEDFDEIEAASLMRIGTPISVDISIGGIQVITKQKIPAGTKLKIVLSILATKTPIDILGKVVWTGDINDESFRTGIEFTKFFNEEDKQVIEDFIG